LVDCDICPAESSDRRFVTHGGACLSGDGGPRCSGRRELRQGGPAGVHVGPVAGALEAGVGGHAVLGDLGVLWVVGFGVAEKILEGDERRREGEYGTLGDQVSSRMSRHCTRGRRPIRVVYLRDEFHLNGLEEIRIRDDDFTQSGWVAEARWERRNPRGRKSEPSMSSIYHSCSLGECTGNQMEAYRRQP
jgi:hypothetical protein